MSISPTPQQGAWQTMRDELDRRAAEITRLRTERDEAVRLLQPFVQFNTSEAVLTITVPASAVTAARAFLSRLGGNNAEPALTEDKTHG